MGKVRCAGELCWDEETGKVYFIPSKCDKDSYAVVKQEAVDKGIGFAQPVEEIPKPGQPTKKKE